MTKRLEQTYFDDETTENRLRQVVRVLDEVNGNLQLGVLEFDMGKWFEFIYSDPSELDDDSGINVCGTSGCAIGYCTQDEWFQNRGLRLIANYFPGVDGRNNEGFFLYEIFYNLSHFFKTDYNTVHALFSFRYFETPRDVIVRIEHYLNTGELI